MDYTRRERYCTSHFTTIMNFAPLWRLFCLTAFAPGNNRWTGRRGVLTYTREHLPSLRPIGGSSSVDLPADCYEIRRPGRWPERQKKERKKRGSRGGVKHRLWKRRNRLPLPVITLSNVRSVSNELDELVLRAEHDCEFRQSDLLCFTETWLKDITTLRV